MSKSNRRPDNVVAFRDTELLPDLLLRDESAGIAAKRLLGTALLLLDEARNVVALPFSQAVTLVTVLGGRPLEPAEVKGLPSVVRQAMIRQNLQDTPAGSLLGQRLWDMDYLKRWAVADAVEMFWRLGGLGENEVTVSRLRKVGLLSLKEAS